MATYTKTLKEDNGDITYPQTLASVVFTSDNSDVQTKLNSCITAAEATSTQEIDLSTLLSKIYPVGSIYMSATMSTTSQVEAALGGTWVAWGAGRVPVGVDIAQTEFDTAEETGGEKTHTLSVDEMPNHGHNLGQMYDGYHLTGNTSQPRGVYADYAQSVPTTKTGGGQAHNNLQPYITCYMYKRTA